MRHIGAKEFLVSLYFASLGVSVLGIQRLILSKCGVRTEYETVRRRISQWRQNDILYDRDRREWHLKRVGEYLENDQYRGRRRYNNIDFEAIIRFSQLTEDIVGASEVVLFFLYSQPR